jgi:hypothetical protein
MSNVPPAPSHLIRRPIGPPTPMGARAILLSLAWDSRPT